MPVLISRVVFLNPGIRSVGVTRRCIFTMIDETSVPSPQLPVLLRIRKQIGFPLIAAG
jgi:hypothetical protein